MSDRLQGRCAECGLEIHYDHRDGWVHSYTPLPSPAHYARPAGPPTMASVCRWCDRPIVTEVNACGLRWVHPDPQVLTGAIMQEECEPDMQSTTASPAPATEAPRSPPTGPMGSGDVTKPPQGPQELADAIQGAYRAHRMAEDELDRHVRAARNQGMSWETIAKAILPTQP